MVTQRHGDRTETSPVRRVVVMAGGWSAERDVSRASGRAVAETLCQLGYDVTFFDPALLDFTTVSWDEVDVVFLALHGGCGEDGTIQAMLERTGVPYTGSPPEACRLAMSKHMSKQRFRQAGVPTPEAVVCLPDMPWAEVRRRVSRIGYPVVVKPDRQGSSIGITVVHDPAELEPAVHQAAQYDTTLLIERYVGGRELTVALLGDSPLPPVEIAYFGECFDYRAKYQVPDTRYLVPANLTETELADVCAAACTAAAVLGCRSLSRVDLRLDDEGKPWVLEVNTIPGLTPRSLAPMAAQAAGLDFAALCIWMLEEAVERHRNARCRPEPHFRKLADRQRTPNAASMRDSRDAN